MSIEIVFNQPFSQIFVKYSNIRIEISKINKFFLQCSKFWQFGSVANVSHHPQFLRQHFTMKRSIDEL